MSASTGYKVTGFALNTKRTGYPKKLCITTLTQDVVIVDLEKSKTLGQVVSKGFTLDPKNNCHLHLLWMKHLKCYC